MLILSLGSDYFHAAFHQLGHTVVIPPHQEGYPLDTLFNNLRDRPDIVVYTDHLGIHFWPDGISNIYGIPKVYYAVDTPINFWWQKHFAKLFDYVFVDQKPYVSKLNDLGVHSSWLPVGVNSNFYLPHADAESQEEKPYDFGFVGVVDGQRRPKRARLMNLLSQRYTIKTAGAREDGWIGPDESSQIYRKSKLALNENLFPGVTMRMLEAMASGSVLFTEKAGGDLGELFKAGEDFAWFEPKELLEAAELWLGDDKLRKRASKRALDKVHSYHDIVNRAESLFEGIKGLNPGSAHYDSKSWDSEAKMLFLTALRWPKEEGRARIQRSYKLFLKAEQEGVISPEGLFMLGQIERLKKNQESATAYLTRAYEAGEPKGALGMGILHLIMQKPQEASMWLGRFTDREDFPALKLDTLSFEAVKLIAAKLLSLGEDICPGFSRLPHDPAVWTAFEYYQSAFSTQPEDLEIARNLAGILLAHGATAEAMDIAQKALAHNPDDEVLGSIFTEAGRDSYITVN
ncbi:MAG: glycosyltransferase [Deltaproteobacteria bacterium]|jgi:tetratricopeptide (TPR) repeat protein|nr:glycosyltransferase [Deltaproteobacteria bacterium]